MCALAGQSARDTGAGRGIGKAIALRLAADAAPHTVATVSRQAQGSSLQCSRCFRAMMA
jgi:NAD(P)-dependent dehydrogenase (short-subunit alcohol dehydrogenase family)